MKKVNPHVSLLFRMGESFLNLKLKKSGLTSGTANLLLEISLHYGISLTDLSRNVGVDNAHTSRAVTILEKKGFALRKPDPDDGRAYIISISDKGLAAAGLVENAMAEWAAIVSKGVSKKDKASVNRILDMLYENARNYFSGIES